MNRFDSLALAALVSLGSALAPPSTLAQEGGISLLGQDASGWLQAQAPAPVQEPQPGPFDDALAQLMESHQVKLNALERRMLSAAVGPYLPIGRYTDEIRAGVYETMKCLLPYVRALRLTHEQGDPADFEQDKILVERFLEQMHLSVRQRPTRIDAGEIFAVSLKLMGALVQRQQDELFEARREARTQARRALWRIWLRCATPEVPDPTAPVVDPDLFYDQRDRQPGERDPAAPVEG